MPRGFWGFGRGMGYGRGLGYRWPGAGRGNPYPFCRAFPWLPRGWRWSGAYGPMTPYPYAPYGAYAPSPPYSTPYAPY